MKKPRTKAEMVHYLQFHDRYWTMNSWNRSTSFAKCIKVHSLGLDRETVDACYAMLDIEDAYWDFNWVLRQFAEKYDYKYQIWQNGRSGGYLVLGQGGSRPSEYKRICNDCLQRNHKQSTTKCGRCGSENMRDYEGIDVFMKPGLSFGEDDDFSEWCKVDLRWLVDIVWAFDKATEDAVQAFIDFATNHTVEEKTIQVPTKIMVAVPKGEQDAIPLD